MLKFYPDDPAMPKARALPYHPTTVSPSFGLIKGTPEGEPEGTAVRFLCTSISTKRDPAKRSSSLTDFYFVLSYAALHLYHKQLHFRKP